MKFGERERERERWNCLHLVKAPNASVWRLPSWTLECHPMEIASDIYIYVCVHQNSQFSSQGTSYEHHLNQSLVLFYVMFILCFTTGKAHGCGTFPKCRTMLGYCLILGPIFLEFPAPWGLTLLKIAYKTRNQKTETFFPSVRCTYIPWAFQWGSMR